MTTVVYIAKTNDYHVDGKVIPNDESNADCARLMRDVACGRAEIVTLLPCSAPADISLEDRVDLSRAVQNMQSKLSTGGRQWLHFILGEAI